MTGRIEAVFQRQEWVGDNAARVGEPVAFDATEKVLSLPPEGIRKLFDDQYETDALAEDLPERIGHGGPFFVRAEQAVCDFFGVDALSEITDAAVAEKRVEAGLDPKTGKPGTARVGKFLACPDCGCAKFVEVTLEYCSQGGVRIPVGGGEPDYEKSEGMEVDGVTERVVHYRCEGCRAEWTRGDDGVLVAKG